MPLFDQEDEEVEMEVLLDCTLIGETPKAWRIQQNTQHGYRDAWVAKSISEWDPDEGVFSYENWADVKWTYITLDTKPF